MFQFLWVGRKKVCGLSPLVLLRGSEEVGETGAESLSKRTGIACPLGEGWSGRVFRLPQGLGKY